jgi:acyl-CoA thioester hydrolase
MSAHLFRLRVYYEDTDAGGIVYYANYLKFAERGRTEALLDLGWSQSELRARLGLVFVVRSARIEFRAPARLEDQLVVTTEVSEIGGARLGMLQAVRRGETLLARVEVALAVLGEDGRPRRMPPDLRAALARLRRPGSGIEAGP